MTNHIIIIAAVSVGIDALCCAGAGFNSLHDRDGRGTYQVVDLYGDEEHAADAAGYAFGGHTRRSASDAACLTTISAQMRGHPLPRNVVARGD
jgi:hypothetical protein